MRFTEQYNKEKNKPQSNPDVIRQDGTASWTVAEYRSNRSQETEGAYDDPEVNTPTNAANVTPNSTSPLRGQGVDAGNGYQLWGVIPDFIGNPNNGEWAARILRDPDSYGDGRWDVGPIQVQ